MRIAGYNNATAAQSPSFKARRGLCSAFHRCKETAPTIGAHDASSASDSWQTFSVRLEYKPSRSHGAADGNANSG